MEGVRRLQGGESASALARELEVKRSKLYDCALPGNAMANRLFPVPDAAPAARSVSKSAAKARLRSPRWSARLANRRSR